MFHIFYFFKNILNVQFPNGNIQLIVKISGCLFTKYYPTSRQVHEPNDNHCKVHFALHFFLYVGKLVNSNHNSKIAGLLKNFTIYQPLCLLRIFCLVYNFVAITFCFFDIG